MIERIRVSGTSSSPGVTTEAAGAAGALLAAGAGAATVGAATVGAAAAGGAGAGLAAAGVPPLAKKPRMSSLVIRPAEPVPGTCRKSSLFSRAMRRTNGEERTRSPVSSSPVSTSGADSATVGWALGAAGWAVGAAATEPVPITATTVLICTVVPACTLISESTPATGEGISASTLSVEISKRGSSCRTVSPGFFNHFVMVPSKIDSPIWGMITSVKEGGAEDGAGAGAAVSAAEAGAGELVGLGGAAATEFAGAGAAGA